MDGWMDGWSLFSFFFGICKSREDIMELFLQLYPCMYEHVSEDYRDNLVHKCRQLRGTGYNTFLFIQLLQVSNRWNYYRIKGKLTRQISTFKSTSMVYCVCAGLAYLHRTQKGRQFHCIPVSRVKPPV